MNFLRNAQERQLFARRLRERQRSLSRQQNEKELDAKEQQEDAIWKHACEQGCGDGNVRIVWQHLPRVSDRLYNFSRTYGRDLVHLALDGTGLRNLQHIPHHCQELRHLSLASNAIDDITGINLIAKLEHLNLLRNNLTTLPVEIGGLVNLETLHLANNSLSQLPSSIGNLVKLDHLNIESNELTELPRELGNLNCLVLNLNFNKFYNVPDCVLSMKNLRVLSVMGNELSCLPIGLERFIALEELHASRNKINVLSDSIVNMHNLRELWLEHNQLSSLPPMFHRLTSLTVLKLDCNPMVYPNMDIVAIGAEQVLLWSRSRVSRRRVDKVRNIVQSLKEILLQIQRYKVGGDLLDSVFRVVDDDTFQLVPDALWSVLLPGLHKIWNDPDTFCGGLSTFPFERSEVEKAIFAFQDAAGSVATKTSTAKFESCSCPEKCIPSRDGWMCTRNALVLRLNMVYEENMIERRQRQAEEKKTKDAAKSAALIAQKYLETDEGMMYVRDGAERRIATSSKASKALSTQNVSSRSSFASIASRFRRESFKTQRKRIEAEIRREYIDQEVETKVTSVKQENKHVKRFAKKWVGNTVEDIFDGWRKLVRLSSKQRRQKARARLCEERRIYENDIAAYELKNLQVRSIMSVLLRQPP